MQTLYYSTSNWIRHTDNIVDLEQYRRKLSQAEDHQPAEGPELIVLPQPSAPRTRRRGCGGAPSFWTPGPAWGSW